MAAHAAEATNSGLVQLSDAQYDLFRAILEKVLPAAAAFYALLAGLWHWAYIVEVTGTIGGLGIFLGVLLALARRGYTPPKEVVPPADIPKDGQVVSDIIDGQPVVRVELDSEAKQNLLNKDVLVIQGFDPEA